MDLGKYQTSRLDMDISSNRDVAMRSEGYPADAVATGIALAVIVVGAGVSWTISQGKKLLDK